MEYFPIIESLRKPASSFAGDIDWLFAMVTLVVGVWFFLTLGMFFWLCIRYRARPGVSAMYVTGKEKHLKKWINVPHILIIICDVFVIFYAIQVWYNVKQDMPIAGLEEGVELDSGDAYPTGMMEIDIIAQQWAWTFVHPGADNQLYTDDDIRTVDELHVENNRIYHFNLKSTDVLHDFSVPVLRLKQDAIPGRIIRGWFKPTETGGYDVQCAEMCGIGHGLMPAKIFIESPEDHASWIKKQG